MGRKRKWTDQGWVIFQIYDSFKIFEWKICFSFKGIEILLSQLTNAWIKKKKTNQNMTKCTKALTSCMELRLINAILGLALLFFLLVLEKQKNSGVKHFQSTNAGIDCTSVKGEWRNLLQKLIDDSSETSSVGSANPYYPHPCLTFCYITPCSVFSSVLVLVYIAAAAPMKERNCTCLVGRVLHWHTGLWYNCYWDVSTDPSNLTNIDVLTMTLVSLSFAQSKGWAMRRDGVKSPGLPK